MKVRIINMQDEIKELKKRIDELEERIDTINTKLSVIGERVIRIDEDVKFIKKQIISNGRKYTLYVLAMVLSFIAAVLGLHWVPPTH